MEGSGSLPLRLSVSDVMTGMGCFWGAGRRGGCGWACGCEHALCGEVGEVFGGMCADDVGAMSGWGSSPDAVEADVGMRRGLKSGRGGAARVRRSVGRGSGRR